MSEPKTIYYPKCGRKVGTYDGKASMNLVTTCRKCRKQVIYDVKTKETKTKPLPQRTASSGMTF